MDRRKLWLNLVTVLVVVGSVVAWVSLTPYAPLLVIPVVLVLVIRYTLTITVFRHWYGGERRQ
jgi:hypothetical protein